MNDLTREASKRADRGRISRLFRFPVLGQPKLTDEQKKRHQAKLDETRPLKWRRGDYLTGLEPSDKGE